MKERRTYLDLPTYYFTLYSVESDTLYDKGRKLDKKALNISSCNKVES